jgi:hypothetical protein
MVEDRWQQLHEPWERLMWARERWQQEGGAVDRSASAAAESLGLKEGTYRQYERRPGTSRWVPLDHQKAMQFGRKFKVSWRWLLLGDGTPFDESLAPEIDRLVEAVKQLAPDEQAMLASMAEGLVRQKTGT